MPKINSKGQEKCKFIAKIFNPDGLDASAIIAAEDLDGLYEKLAKRISVENLTNAMELGRIQYYKCETINVQVKVKMVPKVEGLKEFDEDGKKHVRNSPRESILW